MSFLHNLIVPSLAVLVSMAMPGGGWAAGTESDSAPTPTETSTTCKDGTVWDETEKKCVEIQGSLLSDDALFIAARELAYAGRHEDALLALAEMDEGDTDRVLTYKGFAMRKAGMVEEGMAYYDRALAQNPDNLLARSYMGQGLVEQGEILLASAQLDEIVVRGGAGTWAETSLRQAIRTGVTYGY